MAYLARINAKALKAKQRHEGGKPPLVRFFVGLVHIPAPGAPPVDSEYEAVSCCAETKGPPRTDGGPFQLPLRVYRPPSQELQAHSL